MNQMKLPRTNPPKGGASTNAGTGGAAAAAEGGDGPAPPKRARGAAGAPGLFQYPFFGPRSSAGKQASAGGQHGDEAADLPFLPAGLRSDDVQPPVDDGIFGDESARAEDDAPAPDARAAARAKAAAQKVREREQKEANLLRAAPPAAHQRLRPNALTLLCGLVTAMVVGGASSSSASAAAAAAGSAAAAGGGRSSDHATLASCQTCAASCSHAIDCAACGLLLCPACDSTAHANFHLHPRTLKTFADASTCGLDAEEFVCVAPSSRCALSVSGGQARARACLQSLTAIPRAPPPTTSPRSCGPAVRRSSV